MPDRPSNGRVMNASLFGTRKQRMQTTCHLMRWLLVGLVVLALAPPGKSSFDVGVKSVTNRRQRHSPCCSLRSSFVRAQWDNFGRGGSIEKGAERSPLEGLRGRKLVKTWSGDLLDAVKSAALGTGTGLAARAVLRVATGVMYNVAFTATVGGLGIWAGVLAVDWRRINNALRGMGIPESLLAKRESILRKIDADGDGKLTPNDINALKEEFRRFARSNEHVAFGGVVGFCSAFFLV